MSPLCVVAAPCCGELLRLPAMVDLVGRVVVPAETWCRAHQVWHTDTEETER